MIMAKPVPAKYPDHDARSCVEVVAASLSLFFGTTFLPRLGGRDEKRDSIRDTGSRVGGLVFLFELLLSIIGA